MQNIYLKLVRLSDLLFRIEKIVLLLTVVVVVAVNFLNVCLRYVANYSLNFCETLSVVLFMVLVLLGANIAVKTDNEIKIEILKFKQPSKQAVLSFIIDLVVLFTLVVSIYGIYNTVGAVLRHQQRLTPLPLYTYHVYSVMLIGFALVLIDRLILCLKHLLTACGYEISKEPEAV